MSARSYVQYQDDCGRMRIRLNHDDQTQRFYSLIWPHAAMVLRMARFLLHDQAEAEDLAQETLIRAFSGIHAVDERGDARAWLMAILRNLRIDRLRLRGSRPDPISLDDLPVELADVASATSTADTEWTNPEALLGHFSDADIIDALSALPEEIRWTLLLVDVEELDHADASRILDVPVGTVKSRAHRGRMMLRKALLPIARQLRLIK